MKQLMGDLCSEVELYPTLLHKPEEGVDYLHGILRLGEDALVGLDGEAHACLLEPPHGIMLGEAAEHATHEFIATGIDLLKATDLGEGVGEVAPATASDGDFGKRFAASLEDMDFGMGHPPLYVNGAEATRCSCANYCNLQFFTIEWMKTD
jgi:hypothetical protein